MIKNVYFMQMQCPYCRHLDSRVIDSRTSEDRQTIRRRRECPECKRRFSTVETSAISVIKRSGLVEPFSQAKIISGLNKACQGRPVSEDQIALLAQKVEEEIRATGQAQIDSDEVGRAILRPIKEIDKVAYIRFASVYHAFNSIEDFENVIAELKRHANEAI